MPSTSKRAMIRGLAGVDILGFLFAGSSVIVCVGAAVAEREGEERIAFFVAVQSILEVFPNITLITDPFYKMLIISMHLEIEVYLNMVRKITARDDVSFGATHHTTRPPTVKQPSSHSPQRIEKTSRSS